MTITSIARLTSLQHTAQRHTATHSNTSTQCTKSQLETHIYNLIQQGEVFKARYQLNLINRTNGYIVIPAGQFRIWHNDFLKNKNSNIKTDKSQSQFSRNQNRQNLKNQNSNNKSKKRQKENQKSNISSSDFQKQFQKAYMELLSR